MELGGAEKSTNLMESTWTKAAIVRRKFKAGKKRQKDLEYDLERAILEARILFIEFRAAMLKEGIPTSARYARAALVLMTPDESDVNRVSALSVPRDLDGLPELADRAARLERAEKVVPLGVAIWQRDPEAGEQVAWVHPWRVNQRAQQAAKAAEKAFVASEGKDTNAEF